MTNDERSIAIRELNDEARQLLACHVYITPGIQSLADLDREAVVRNVVGFDHFGPDNDPYGEHDFGAIYQLASGGWAQRRPDQPDQIAQTVFWKIDYYDARLEFGSEAPWDPEATSRVLTILLASEY